MIEQKIHTEKEEAEAENWVLGSLLVDADSITKVADILKPSDFLREKNQWVYEAVCELYINNKIINQLTVAYKLSEKGLLDPSGGAEFLTHLVANTGTSVHIESYADIIIQCSIQRQIKQASKRIEELSEWPDTEKAKAAAIEALINLGVSNEGLKIQSPTDMANYALERYTNLKSGDNNAIISFGIPFIDKLGGMQGGNTIIIAGPSGKGKTTLAMQIALNVGKVHGPVLFVSLEMSKDEMTDRNIARLTGKYVLEIMKGGYSELLWENITDAIGPLSAENIHYLFPPVATVPMIYTASRRMQIQSGLAMVVVDYIQLIGDAGGGGNMDEKLTNISHSIKSMARELNVPIIGLSQENRKSDAPILDRTRGSGTISHDASWVLYLERDTSNTELSKLTIAKQRQGGAETEHGLSFDWRRQAFKEIQINREEK